MAKSARTISFNILATLSERNARRDARSVAVGYAIDDFSFESITLDPQESKTVTIPSTFLFVSSNAAKGAIVLDYSRSTGTTALALNKLMLLTDFTGVTTLVLRNSAANGTPSENVNLIKG